MLRQGDNPSMIYRPFVQLMRFTSPCYDGLKNNVATTLMRTKLNAWPPGTPEYVSHRILKEYIQDTARKTGVEGLTIFGANVSNLKKSGDEWIITFSTLRKDSLNEVSRDHVRSLV
jgi:hypothetical protein